MKSAYRTPMQAIATTQIQRGTSIRCSRSTIQPSSTNGRVNDAAAGSSAPLDSRNRLVAWARVYDGARTRFEFDSAGSFDCR